MTQQFNGDSMGKGGGGPPLGQRQAVAGTSGTGAGGIWKGMEGKRRVGEGAEGDCPIPDPNKAESIFVPFLPQIGTFSTENEWRKEKAEKIKRRRGFEQQMEGGGCRMSRRAFGLALVLSLVLISGAFALFDSLLDDSEEERPNSENGDESMSDEDVKNYLNRFGYIEGASMEADQPAASAGVFAQQKHRTADELLGDFSLDSLKSAIQRFQEFAGLPKTGELDNRTKKKMKQPRCGMQDVEMMSRTEGEGGMKWRKRQLTYRIDHFTADLPHYMQKKALQMAFDAWSKQIPLDFSETTGHQQADIRVRFARGSHGDPWPFDGRGGVLAHATFPSDGQLHFDDDEQWAFMDASKISSFRYTDLFWVSLHEIGHVLGLSHSKVETAIMAPFYRDPDEMVDWRGNYKTPELTYDDIQAAQQIYGKRRNGNGNGGGNRRGKGRDEGHYDDSEGGFLSQLGKLFGGEEEDEGEGGGQRSRNGGNDGREGNGRRSYSKGGHRRNGAEEEEEEDGIFGKYFSSTARSSKANFPILALFAILPLILSVFSRI